MKRTFSLIALCTLLLGCGCTKDFGNPTTKNYAINGTYNKLNVSDAFQVTVSSQVTDVEVTVDERAHDQMDVYVKNGTLYIGFKTIISTYTGTAKAVIPANTALHAIDLSGASSFSGNLNGSDVKIDLSGASYYSGDVTASSIELDFSGASKANLRGYCGSTLDIELSGASILYAAGLDAQDVKGDMSGASTADVTCCDYLRVNLSGASTLTYGTTSSSCDPTVRCETSGGSTVRER